MNEIADALSSPFWWFTVVIVGIVINVFAAYLKGHTDILLGKVSGWWINKSKLRKLEHNNRVSKLKRSESERFMLAFLCNRSMQYSIHFAIFAVLPLAFILVLEFTFNGYQDKELNMICLGFSAIMFFSSYMSALSSIRERLLLFDVLKAIDNSTENDS